MRNLFLTILTFGLVLGGCLGEASPANSPDSTAGRSGTPTPLTTAPASPTPLVASITPEAVQYVRADPTFEALPGARAVWGELADGIYRIEVPDAWNGEIVYYAHGYRGHANDLDTGFPPLREHFIDRGYAWAAASYSENGYSVGSGERDTWLLRDVVEREIGRPTRSYLFGDSMGGHVVTLLLEQHPTGFDGAFTMCGAVSGREVLDYFLSWSVIAGFFSDVELWSLTSDPDAFGAAVQDHVFPALGPAVELTSAGRAFASVIQEMTGGPRPFMREGFAAAYGWNFAIVVDAVINPSAETLAAQNVDITYDIGEEHGLSDRELNARVPRFATHPDYRDPTIYPEFAALTGDIRVPLLTLHNTGDLVVPISLEQSYRRKVELAGSGQHLVQRAIRRAGHCAFTQGELRRGFDDLVSWVETGIRPAGDDLLGDLSTAGLTFTDPINPDDPGGIAIP